jgi:hypothetical protein
MRKEEGREEEGLAQHPNRRTVLEERRGLGIYLSITARTTNTLVKDINPISQLRRIPRPLVD